MYRVRGTVLDALWTGLVGSGGWSGKQGDRRWGQQPGHRSSPACSWHPTVCGHAPAA